MAIISEGSREVFRPLVDTLKDIAKKDAVVITDEEIAEKLEISLTKFMTFYNNDWAPPEIFILLKQKYSQYIAGLSIEQIWVLDEKEIDDPDPDFPEEENHQ